MSVQTPLAGEIFTVRSYKRLQSRPDTVWANTYEARLLPGGAGVSTVVNDLVAAVLGWEEQFHLTTVQFDRMVVSTIAEDGNPYNPSTFLSLPTTTTLGNRPTTLNNAGDTQPLGMCLMTRLQVPFGRAGRRLYRGVLLEVDVQSPSGVPQLTAFGADDILTRMEVSGTLESRMLAAGFELVMADPGNVANKARVVQGIEPAGVVLKKLNNRYFDRA